MCIIRSNRKSLLWWWQKTFWANPRDTRVSQLMCWTPWLRSSASSTTSTKSEMGSMAQFSLMDPGTAWLENSLERLASFFLSRSMSRCRSKSSFWDSSHIVLFWNWSPIISVSKMEKIRKNILQPTSANPLSPLGEHLISASWRETHKVWGYSGS